MRICIDSRVLGKKMTGVGRYLLNIVNALPNYDKKNEYIIISKGEINLDNNSYRQISTGNNILPEKLFSSYWLNFVLPNYLKKEKIDLFFTPNYLLPFRRIGKVKTITVIHDIFHKINRKFHPASYNMYLDLLLPGSLKKSDLIITVSNSSKKDLIQVYNIPEEKIRVIYEYADESFNSMELSDSQKNEIKNRYNLPSKFILYVGLIENRKNVTGIIKIADILYEKHIDIKVVIIGRKGYGFEEIYKEIIKRDYIKYINYVDDASLKIIYNIAYLFLFPSYYEGFGLPPLEAMQTGLPVLASKTSSLIEVVGEGGILHEPDNHKAFADDIERLVNDPLFYSLMKEKALTQAKIFSKEKSVKELIDVFNSILS